MHGHRAHQDRESGFTLVELLIAIIVMGILVAVALVGVAGLHDRGATAACDASMDAAKAATLAYYSSSAGQYPQTFAELTKPTTGPALLEPPSGVTQSATTLVGKGGWTLTLQPGPTVTDPTTFTGC